MNVERQISTQRVFSGNIVGLRLDTIELPNGRQATREVVEHHGAVVVLPIDMDGNVLLVRQYRYPVKEMVLEAPAGGIAPGELPEHAACRELGEDVEFAKCYFVDFRPSYSQQIGFAGVRWFRGGEC